MDKKPIYIGLFTGLSAAFLSWLCCREKREPKTINLKIEKDEEGVWRILDKHGSNRATLYVRQGDTVKWQTNKSAAVFTFSKKIDRYFITEKGFFEDGQSQLISKGADLTVTIKNNAPTGPLEYEVLMTEDERHVVGNSPPVMIIRRFA